MSTREKMTITATVVVGVDGSAGSMEALRWALAEACLRGAPLRIVHAWSYNIYAGGAAGGYGAMGGFGSVSALGVDVGDLHRAAEELVQNAIDTVAWELEGLEIEHRVVQGNAGDVLVDAAATDDILVVGSRGYGGFAGLLLGSVSQRCVHRAACPVVVVHAPSGTTGGDEVAHATRDESKATV
jgi:nucleotide-binding universal stress UspA family protein